MERRSLLKTLLTGLAVAPAAQTADRAVEPTPKPDTVSQAELQAVIDTHNRAVRMACSIRLRLELGAPMEPGKLGVSTHSHESLSWYLKCGDGHAAGFQGVTCIDILPIEELAHDKAMEEQYRERDHGKLGFVLV